jgi:hypothetical protein
MPPGETAGGGHQRDPASEAEPPFLLLKHTPDFPHTDAKASSRISGVGRRTLTAHLSPVR